MARLTIRNLDDATMQWLRERGAARGVSMEQEARDVLCASLGQPTSAGFDYTGIIVDPVDDDRKTAVREVSAET